VPRRACLGWRETPPLPQLRFSAGLGGSGRTWDCEFGSRGATGRPTAPSADLVLPWPAACARSGRLTAPRARRSLHHFTGDLQWSLQVSAHDLTHRPPGR
jgi:hypothetical protein